MEMYKTKVSLTKPNQVPLSVIAGLIVFVLTMVCLWVLDVQVIEMIVSLPQFIQFFMTRFLPPSLTNLTYYIKPVYVTLLSAVVATYLSTTLSLIFAFLMAKRTNPYAPLRMVVRGLVSFLRNIPLLVWASVLVYIFGVGSVVGLMALVIVTLGFLSRSYADAIDALPNESFEAVQAGGASYLQMIWHALMPAFMNSWMSWTLYVFEINVRASIILGMVGAGGIGVLIQTNLKLFKYQEALTIIIIVVLLVLLIEWSTNHLRKVLNT